MSRAVTIGNGNLLIGLDHRGQVRDFYFPYAGHSNHVSGASGSYRHRIGVMAGDMFRWLSDDSWNIDIGCNLSSAVSNICAVNDELGVTLTITDAVHNEQDIFLRKISIHNNWETNREIKIFFGQEFRISESRRGDTAFFDPRVGSIIHYKGHIALLVNAEINGNQFTEYSVGLFDSEGKQGTYADAEDGILSKNPIEHGSVDSVIGLSFDAHGKEVADVHYWITAGKSLEKAHELDDYVRKEGAERLITSTERYWHAWIEKESRDLSLLGEDLENLYRHSLAIIRVHSDNRGGIIASSDSDMLNQGRDTYSYVWPRDAAIAANALERGGYTDATQRFFSFMTKQMEKGGFLMHKYRVDGVLGSSWHPWVRNGVTALPIQEDETAITLFMLWKHYRSARDLEFIESLYNSFIEPAADFMANYIEEETGLPRSSYDLWEEKYGTSTYTVCSVYGALMGAAECSALLGKRENARRYRDCAELLKRALVTYLYDSEMGTFIKLVRHENNSLQYDRTIDMSSFHGLTFFEVLEPHDKRVESTYKVVIEHLKVPTSFGGYVRYEGDQYYKTTADAPSNAWCITTLWIAQYYIKLAENREALRRAYAILAWVHDRATKSGVLPEQIHPYTGEHLSTAPLVWSHAEFVITCDEYLKKYKRLEK